MTPISWLTNRVADFTAFMQRGRRGWATRDTWNFDKYLAEVIIGGVTHLQINKNGHPVEITEDQWEEILDKIIDGFKGYLELLDGLDQESEQGHAAMHRYLEGRALFNEWFRHLWS